MNKIIYKCKTRFVIRGLQKNDIDYKETFSPVMKYDIVRLMPIAYCNKSGNNIIRKNCISVWYFSMVIYIIYSRKDYLPETTN